MKFEYINNEDDQAIELAFGKGLAEKRKEWLSLHKQGEVFDYREGKIRYKEFVDKELVVFSNEVNVRSIPNVWDGLKPSERKVIFACFKRNLKGEIKVAQLAGIFN